MRTSLLCYRGSSSLVRLLCRHHSRRRCSLTIIDIRRYFSASPPSEKQDDDDDGKPTKPTTTTPSIIPGVALCMGTATIGFHAASVLSSVIPISGIPLSILLGVAIHNTTGYSETIFKPGIVFSTKTILQCGIVAVAAKLSFMELVHDGTTSIPVVVSAVGAGMLSIPVLGKLARLPKEMSLLLTAGTSICGVTAITALAPAIHANHRDVAVAVANTVAFGTLGMLLYPYLFHSICYGGSEHVGMCLGISIHDTSQVLGAAASYHETYNDEVALKMAAVTKLSRNLGLAVAIPALTFVHHQREGSQGDSTEASDTEKKTSLFGLATFQKYVPNFLVAFVGMAALRSGCDAVFDPDFVLYHQTANFIGNDVSKAALGTAMAGVGLSTSLSSLKGVGWRPFAVGGAGALIVGGTGFTVASMVV